MRHLADSKYSNVWNEGFERCMLERSKRCVKGRKTRRDFETWSCLYREKNQQRLERENIGKRQKKKHVLSTSLCRQLWLYHRRFGSAWNCSLFYQDLLWDRAKPLGLSSPLFALLHCRERHLVVIGIYGIFGRWDSSGQWDYGQDKYYTIWTSLCQLICGPIGTIL